MGIYFHIREYLYYLCKYGLSNGIMMRIVAHRTLVLFYRKHADARTALEDWYHKTKNAEWNSFSEMKKTFNTADAVGSQRYVFDIKGNDYRLVALVLFKIKMVYVRFIGTHGEYDRIEDCSKI